MKFTIRDLFLVTMIAALAVGWWVDHRRQVRSTMVLEGEIYLDYINQLRVTFYTIPFATSPNITFPEGISGYEIDEEKTGSFRAKRIGWGHGIKEPLKWRAEGRPAWPPLNPSAPAPNPPKP